MLQDSPIKTLRDLKGKRVGLGEKESGTLADARIVLEAAGLSEREVKADYSRLSEAAAGIRDKTLDAFFLFGGYPIPAIAELAAATPIRLVPIPDETFDKLKKRYPFFTRSTIPIDAYTGLESETPTASLNALWVVSADVPGDVVFAITKCAVERADAEIPLHPPHHGPADHHRARARRARHPAPSGRRAFLSRQRHAHRSAQAIAPPAHAPLLRMRKRKMPAASLNSTR